MAQKEKKFSITCEYKLYYDINSKVFQQALQDYRDIYNKKATIKGMLEHVIYNISIQKKECMVEGVGWVLQKGTDLTDKHMTKRLSSFSGIFVEDFNPEIEIDNVLDI